jgi:hypothetical protein
VSGEIPHCSRGAHRASMAIRPPFAIVPAPPNFTMRPLRACIDVLIVCSAAAVLVTTLRMYQSGLAEQSDIESTRAALSTIDAEIGIRSALGGPALNQYGHPPSVDPAWFGDAEPRNALAESPAPWIEMALDHEAALMHPTDPTFCGGRGAMFWYNPIRGVVRARVPQQASDATSRELYELVNGEPWSP